MVRSSAKQLANEMAGSFPDLSDLDVNTSKYRVAYLQALNYCSSFSLDELKQIVIEQEQIDDLDLIAPYKFATIGKIAYILSKPYPIHEESKKYYNKVLLSLKKEIEDIKNIEKPVTKTTSNPKIDLYKFSNLIEDYIDSNMVLSTNTVYELLSKNKSRRGLLTGLKEKFTAALDEYRKADSVYAEYFEGVSKKDILYRIRCYTKILEDITLVSENKRAKKTKQNISRKTEKIVSNINYCAHDSTLKMDSANPASIVGAKNVILFNRKTNRLTMLVAETESGLTISGTTVKGFDSNKSTCKTLRKPDQQLIAFRTATRIKRIAVALESIRGKNFDASGRLNADTLVLKVDLPG